MIRSSACQLWRTDRPGHAGARADLRQLHHAMGHDRLARTTVAPLPETPPCVVESRYGTAGVSGSGPKSPKSAQLECQVGTLGVPGSSETAQLECQGCTPIVPGFCFFSGARTTGKSLPGDHRRKSFVGRLPMCPSSVRRHLVAFPNPSAPRCPTSVATIRPLACRAQNDRRAVFRWPPHSSAASRLGARRADELPEAHPDRALQVLEAQRP